MASIKGTSEVDVITHNYISVVCLIAFPYEIFSHLVL